MSDTQFVWIMFFLGLGAGITGTLSVLAFVLVVSR